MPDAAPEPPSEPTAGAERPPEPEVPPEPAPEPPEPEVPPRPLPWWAPGLALGLLAALAAGAAAVGPHGPPGSHRATVRVPVRAADGGPAAAGDRQHVALLFRAREIQDRALAAPEVAALDVARGHPDPARALDARLAVEVDDGFVTATLSGDGPDRLAPVLDHLARQAAAEFAALAGKARDDRLAQLEQLAAALRVELDRQQEAVELVARANGTTGPGDPGGAGPRLRDRLNQVEAELARGAQTVALLERQAEALKRRAEAGAAPDPVEAARLVDTDPRVAPLVAQRADAAVALEREKVAPPGGAPAKEPQARLDRAEKALAGAREPVRKEVDALLREADARRAARELPDVEVRLAVARAGHAADRAERDALGKALAAAHAGGLTVESVRRALGPQQELADRTAAELIRLRGDARVATAVPEPAFAERVRGRWHWGAALRAAAEALVVTFALATAFRLAGLAFRALGEKG